MAVTISPATSPTFAKGAFSWPSSIVNPIPHRYRRKLRSKLRSRQSPASSISAVETSLNPLDTLAALRKHKWSLYDLQYIFLLMMAIFSLSISDKPGPLIKLAASILLIVALLVPVSRQFFLPFLPIGTWLLVFFSARFIPASSRPHIWVRVLPALENILYGANLSNILSAHPHVILDILAWLPYGIIHFSGPFICSIVIFLFAAPTTLPVFASSFGYMNLTGVIIQLVFPCSAPWYENMYGLAPADYSMQGSPAGLARIDALFGVDLYTTNFTATNPMVFGAFPSLHAGNAILEALFMSYCFPKFRPYFIGYCVWLWWATMYLSHHYAVDLVGGSIISAVFFYVAKANWLPRRQPDKRWRWDYDYVEIGEPKVGAEEWRYEYGMRDMGGRRGSEEWTLGDAGSSSDDSASVRSKDAFGFPQERESWEGETLRGRESGELGDSLPR